jgi:hypothetical protein
MPFCARISWWKTPTLDRMAYLPNELGSVSTRMGERMKKWLPFLLFFLVLALTQAACGYNVGIDATMQAKTEVMITPFPTWPYLASTPYQPQNCRDDACFTQCLEHLPKPGGSAEPTPKPMNLKSADFGKNGITLAVYPVNGDHIGYAKLMEDIPAWLWPYQEDTAMHERTWHFFADIIPPEWRDELKGFRAMTDGPDNTLASIYQTDQDPDHWVLEVDVLDNFDPATLAETSFHELAHLISLNSTQVTPDIAVYENPDDQKVFDQEKADCPTYFVAEGCAHSDSYLYQFVKKFWGGLFDEWSKINAIQNAEERSKALLDFYHAHKDEFVSSYASTNPVEDLADSFAAFILAPDPHGEGHTIAEQKILFFYHSPELVTLRSDIHTRVCHLAERGLY